MTARVPYRDSRGIPIEEGCTVAYNIRGDLALGTVVEVPAVAGSSKFRVRLENECAGCFPGHISKVRRSRAILVLRTPDHADVIR